MIFIDEASANLQMHPIYGRGFEGERIHLSAPYQRGNNMILEIIFLENNIYFDSYQLIAFL